MNTQAPAASPWSPRQRYWLQALGHGVLRVAGAEDEAPTVMEEEAAPAPARAPGRPAPLGRDVAVQAPAAQPPRRRAPVASVEAEPATVQAAASQARHGGMRRPAGLPDRLQLAVLRASGLPPTDPRAQALLAEWPSERLRGDPAAKRALWPLLRALRRPA